MQRAEAMRDELGRRVCRALVLENTGPRERRRQRIVEVAVLATNGGPVPSTEEWYRAAA